MIIRLLFLIVCFTNLLLSQPFSLLSNTERELSVQKHLRFELDNIDSLLIYRGFVVKYRYESRIPEFTIHCLSFQQVNGNILEKAKRRSGFFVDEVNLTDCSATNRDYKGSGYDRGHMVPAGDFYWDKQQKDETFSYANIAPQTANLNRGIWARLENLIRSKILSDTCEAIIITGNLLSESETIGVNHVGVPDYYYKIIYLPTQELMYAFLFFNQFANYDNNLRYYQVTVNNIENISGNNFFEKIDDKVEEKLESTLFNLSSLNVIE